MCHFHRHHRQTERQVHGRHWIAIWQAQLTLSGELKMTNLLRWPVDLPIGPISKVQFLKSSKSTSPHQHWLSWLILSKTLVSRTFYQYPKDTYEYLLAQVFRTLFYSTQEISWIAFNSFLTGLSLSMSRLNVSNTELPTADGSRWT
jgi:hypothetical protein